MNSAKKDETVITTLSLDREVIRDLTPDELSGAAGGVHKQPDTTTLCVSIIVVSIITLSPGCSGTKKE